MRHLFREKKHQSTSITEKKGERETKNEDGKMNPPGVDWAYSSAAVAASNWPDALDVRNVSELFVSFLSVRSCAGG